MFGMIQKDDAKLTNLMTAGIWLMVGGFCLGGFGFVMAVLSGSPSMVALSGLGGLGFVVGLIMIGATVLGGLRTEKKAATSTEAVQIPDCVITARFVTNSVGETLFSEEDIFFDDPKVKYFIRIQPSYGRQIELRTNMPVWQSCGEGMRGTAVVQGDWLGSFTHQRGRGEGTPYQ
jgi:hypothetical protein